MTRAEAIKYLKAMKDECNDTCHKVRYVTHEEALDMAIQALSQEPCDDAISRDIALVKMSDYVASGYAESVKDFEEYTKIICQLPSVTQKSGKWIDVGAFYKHECSVCGNSAFGNHRFDEELTDYCPNCGAKMESEDKE